MRSLKNLLSKIRRVRFFTQRSSHTFFEGHLISLPSRHSLFELQIQEPFRHQALKLAAKYFLTEQKNHVIDVGANVGDTAIVMNSGNHTKKTFSLVEPSPFFLKYLNRNSRIIGDCEIIEKFVSPNFPISELSADLQYWGGTALLVDSSTNKVTKSQQILLHELERDNTGIVKIDCDGQDSNILINYLEHSKSLPTIYFENTIASTSDLYKSLEVLELARNMGYGFVSALSNDGLLIWSGELKLESLRDIYQFQLNLTNLNQSNRLSYTDILLVQKSESESFFKFEKELRQHQENHFTSSSKSG
ncbi:hypothetical protein MCEMRE185_01052 [Candidatus Nanopelagicaceae bacterium]